MRIITINEIIKLQHNWKLVTSLLLVFVLATWKFGVVAMLLLVFVCLSFLSLFAAILKSNIIALGLIFTTAFTRVIFHLVGLPRAVPTLFTEFCVLLLLVKALYLQLIVYNKPLRAVGFLPMVGVLAVATLSYIYNQSEILPAIFFVRQIFTFYLFFIALLNLNLSEKTILKINRFIIFLFLIQLPAALIKVITIGQDERWIGTVSWQAAQLSTMLPLFAISFLFAFYFFKRDKKYLLLVAGSFLFGIAGQKKSLALLIPVVSGVVWYLYGKRAIPKKRLRLRVSQMKYLFIICVISYLGIFSASRILKSEMYGGHLDVKRLIDYIIWYNTRDQIALYGADNPDHSMGRVTITILSLNRLKESGLIQQLIGFGPGAMILSPHLGRKEMAFEQFGLRGAIPGFVMFVLQVGFLGVMFWIYFFLKLFKKAYTTYQKSYNPNFKAVVLGFMGATFTFILDFFIYGTSTMFLGILTPVYFHVAAIVFRGDSQNFKISSLS